ncbi:MAG: hypothetical protein ABW252_06920 [Polyangiales bacterium]
MSVVNSMPPPQTSKRPSVVVVEEAPSASSMELTRFALSAARRHWLLGLAVMLLSGALGMMMVSVIPATYESNAKIFDTQSTNITATVAGGRRGDEGGMRGIRETVFNRANLLSIVRESKLVERWKATRTWPLVIKDDLMAYLFGVAEQKDLERGMVGLLEERAVTVQAEENSSIRFKVQLRDPVLARDVTDLVQRNFLEQRRKAEFAAIERGIALLEEEKKRADEDIEPAIKEMEAMMAKVRQKKIDAATKRLTEATTPAAGAPRKAARAPAPAQLATTPVPVAPRPPPPEVTERLEEIRRAQRNVLEPWQRLNAELKFKLTELRASYGPQHPAVRSQEARVSAASLPPPELLDLKQQEQALLASVASFSEATPAEAARPAGIGPRSVGPSARTLLEQEGEDPELGVTRVRLNATLDKAREVRDRLDAAHMEMATATVGFKHRYAVVEPAEVSRKPVKPKRELLYGVAIGVALLLGLLVGAVRELMTGRIVEPWQVRNLGLDVLAEVNLSEPPSR